LPQSGTHIILNLYVMYSRFLRRGGGAKTNQKVRVYFLHVDRCGTSNYVAILFLVLLGQMSRNLSRIKDLNSLGSSEANMKSSHSRLTNFTACMRTVINVFLF
jgi:hypothetical protein